ncbi:glycosyltransferase family 2 protein [Empedobacter sp. UBA1574]|uniref:glycosyltransferase family 2 protein n=1 Tax=Empedobacter sp. UBA1574 TaxID=1946429 RepID=UPI0025BF536C|nr:glycosyltransferase family 2 protein [Empedobacter sp. UBA1574]
MIENKISVCLASYNGQKYIKEQLESILSQLRIGDEVIISDDNSTDKTIEIINGFNDSRIKVIPNTNFKGVIGNFENAIKNASGDFIFLSDQDDIWRSDKVQVIIDFFEANQSYSCIFSNAAIINNKGQRIGKRFFQQIPKLKFYKLLLKNKFLGCTMAFKNNLNILPFRQDLPMHDWYIGLKHIQKGKVGFINEDLIYYRRHGGNVTTGNRSSLLQVLKWRILMLKSL